MTKRLKLLTATMLAICMSGAAPVFAAKGDVLYKCDFVQMTSRGGGWIPSQLYLVYNPGTGNAEVIDSVIKHFVGKPIPVRLTQETKARIGFAWTLTIKDSSNQQAPMEYRFTYFKNGQPAQMTAQPGGYDNSWSGSGKCALGTP